MDELDEDELEDLDEPDKYEEDDDLQEDVDEPDEDELDELIIVFLIVFCLFLVFFPSLLVKIGSDFHST